MYIYIYTIYSVYIYIYMVVLSTYNLQFVRRHSEVDFLASSRCVHCPQEHKEKDPVRRSPGGINSADFECWNRWNHVVCQRLQRLPYTMCPQLTQFPPSASNTFCNLVCLRAAGDIHWRRFSFILSRHSLQHSERSQVQLISVVSIGLSSSIIVN